ncbi:MAG: hypothetical protein ABR569_13760 [Gaiellaceae bacterium]
MPRLEIARAERTGLWALLPGKNRPSHSTIGSLQAAAQAAWVVLQALTVEQLRTRPAGSPPRGVHDLADCRGAP